MITYPHYPVKIVGDFNLPRVSWSTTDNGSFAIMRDGVKNGVRSAATCLSDCSYNNTLYQTVDIENTKSNALDLCFSNIQGVLSERYLDFLFEGLSDRLDSPLHITVPTQSDEFYCFETSLRNFFHSSDNIIVRNYKNVDYELVASSLYQVDWDTLFYQKNSKCTNNFL